ncbi:helix-turn-helix transcriptional regulator [Clostridium sp. NSJ-49]|uniref:helix-turn-helix domain-containing protein n=1 Tax=Clostridium TaxID=1485 RepID=UPI00164C0DD3|nr:helix-turn-helix transcriptional regulator [Clostridium sp. NSJ-49]MBC5624425.1 helix-turn-helix transcriptional regulator [Clostridium sp. NSJ-49]
MSLGKRLKKFRKCNRLSLKELSALTNLSISFLSDIEHDRSNPSINNLKILSSALNIPMYHLLEDPNSPSSDNSIDFSELVPILMEFEDWDNEDKIELFYYLKAKKTIRDLKK